MISLRKTANELELLQASLRAAEEYYAKMIRACGDGAVEYDAQAAQDLRDQLHRLETQFKSASSTTEFRIAYESTRNHLESYQQVGRDRIRAMREDLKSASVTLRIFAEGISLSSAEYESLLRHDVERLEGLAHSDDLAYVKAGITNCSAAILQSHNKLEQSQRLVITQLQSEIRALHSAIENDRKRGYTDIFSGAWNRQKITERIDLLLTGSQPFWVLALEITNFRKIQSRYSQHVLQGAVRCLLSTLRELLLHDCAVGRWGDDLYLVVIDAEPNAVIGVSAELKRKLPSLYTVPDAGAVQTVRLDVSLGIVDRRQGVDAGRFYLKLKQITEALASSA
jgi:GGDEF domain-containing protein